MKVSVSFDTYTFQNLVGSNTVICVRKFLHSKWQRYRTFKFYKLIICSESVSISDNRLSYRWFLYWCQDCQTHLAEKMLSWVQLYRRL